MKNVSEALKPYLREATDTLPQAEQRRLTKAYQQGDEEAGNTLVRSYLKFCAKVAVECNNGKLTIEEMFSAACEGLVRGLKRFSVDDPRYSHIGVLTYVVHWMQQQCRVDARSYNLIRQPHNRYAWVGDFRKFKQKEEQKEGRELSIQEACRRFIPPKEKMELDDRLSWVVFQESPVSLDGPMGGEGEGRDKSFFEYYQVGGAYYFSLAAEEKAASERVEEEERVSCIDEALSRLTEEEEYIVCRYFGLNGHEPSTLEEISRALGRSRQRVDQILNGFYGTSKRRGGKKMGGALEKMKKALAREWKEDYTTCS